MEKQYKIALLIDAENVSRKYVKLILDEISEYGVVTYKRVYGDFASPGVSSWKNSLMDYAMTPVFQINYTKGKNASDSAMVIDAMDILYSGRVDAFCLVTSDSDFTKLAIRLREAGMLVVGMGEQKTPGSLVAACETFKFLDLLYRENVQEEAGSAKASVSGNESVIEKEGTSGGKKSRKTAEKGKKERPASKEGKEDKNAASEKTRQENAQKESRDAANQEEAPEAASDENSVPSKKRIGKEITAIINSQSDEEGWVNLADVGNLLSKRVPGFDPRNYGAGKKLRTFVESYDCFETHEIPNPKSQFLKIVYVRLKEK